MRARPWPRQPAYSARSDGAIIGPSGRPLNPWLGGKGYYTIGVSFGREGQKTIAVHVIVAESWHGPRPAGHQVAHNNGVRTDNRASNLRWATISENHADKRAHGTSPQGERQGGSKLTDADVIAIRAAYAGGSTQAALAADYGVGQGTISNAVLGSTWTHLPTVEIPTGGRKVRCGVANGRARFSEDDVRSIRRDATAGVTLKDLTDRFRCSESAIRHILAYRVWKHVS